MLARLAARILEVPEVVAGDNFFQLGGDTTAAMRLLLDAESAGLGLERSQLRRAKDVAELARAAAPVSRTPAAPSASGPIALGPTARWFLGWAGRPLPRWNLLTVAAADGPLDAAILSRATRAAVGRHDALRFRLERDGSSWRSALQDEPGLAVERVTLAGVSLDRHAGALRAAADALHAAVGIADGPPARVLHVDRGPDHDAVVMVCANHLVSDAYSQAVLLQDIEVAYEQLAAGAPAAPPAPTATMRELADTLTRLAGSPAVEAERAHWLRMLGDGGPSVPLDFPAGRNSSDAVRSCAVGLSPEQTRRLFLASHRAPRRGTLNLVLTAIAQAWARWSGLGELSFQLLSHGRDRESHGLDLHRTVACCSHAYPVRVSLPGAGGPVEVAEAVGDALAAIPRRGLGYSLLRYVREDEEVAAVPQPEISVNYRGRLAPAGHSVLGTRLASLSGVRLDPGPSRSMILEIELVVENGGLQTRWLYCGNLHRHESIARVAEDYLATLNGLIDGAV